MISILVHRGWTVIVKQKTSCCGMMQGRLEKRWDEVGATGAFSGGADGEEPTTQGGDWETWVQLLVQGDPVEEKGHSTPVFLPRESRGLQRVRHDWASEPMHRSSRNRRGLYKQYYYVRSNKTWHDRLWEETELVKILLSFFTLIIMYHKGVWGKHISLTISMLILIWSRASEGIYLGI